MPDNHTTNELHIISLEEAAANLIARGGVPGLLDAAENVVIGYDMGWDMGVMIEALRKAIDI